VTVLTEREFPLGVRLSKIVNGITIEVWFNREEELKDALALLNRLCDKTEFETIRTLATEGVHKVALSLLEVWPNCKRPIAIQGETGLSSGSVSNILTGQQGGSGRWFERCDNGWKLSTIGHAKTINDVITSLKQSSSLPREERPTDNE
jgi:hypothetical protein